MNEKDIEKFEKEINSIYHAIKDLKFRAKTILISIQELEEDFQGKLE